MKASDHLKFLALIAILLAFAFFVANEQTNAQDKAIHTDERQITCTTTMSGSTHCIRRTQRIYTDQLSRCKGRFTELGDLLAKALGEETGFKIQLSDFATKASSDELFYVGHGSRYTSGHLTFIFRDTKSVTNINKNTLLTIQCATYSSCVVQAESIVPKPAGGECVASNLKMDDVVNTPAKTQDFGYYLVERADEQLEALCDQLL